MESSRAVLDFSEIRDPQKNLLGLDHSRCPSLVTEYLLTLYISNNYIDG